MAIKVAAEHSCMLFQSAVLCNVVQQVVHNQATTQLQFASNSHAASQW